MYIIVSTSCNDCDKQSFKLMNDKPSDEQIRDVEEYIGGMFCIKSKVYNVDIDEIVDKEEFINE